jgi:hypothetical protein
LFLACAGICVGSPPPAQLMEAALLPGSRETRLNGHMPSYLDSRHDDPAHMGDQLEVTTSSEAVSEEAPAADEVGRQGHYGDAGHATAHLDSFLEQDRSAEDGAGPGRGPEEAEAAEHTMHEADGECCRCPDGLLVAHAFKRARACPKSPPA